MNETPTAPAPSAAAANLRKVQAERDAENAASSARRAASRIVWKRRAVIGAAGLAVSSIFTAVGGPAAAQSYRHSIVVAEHFSKDHTVTPWLPLTTDGMLVAGLVLIAIARMKRQKAPHIAILSFVLGMVATFAANIGATVIENGFTWGGIVVALWPPLALALTLELVSATVTLVRGPKGKPTKPTAPVAGTAPKKSMSARPPVVSASPNGPAGLTDEEIIGKARAYMNENAADAMRVGTLRRLYKVGPKRAEKIAAILNAAE